MLREGEILWTLYKSKQDLNNWQVYATYQREFDKDGKFIPRSLNLPLVSDCVADQTKILFLLLFSKN